MSSTVDEFAELLNAEVHIDIDKLRDSARHGVPEEVRGQVWKYLLGVEEPDRSHEMSDDKEKSEEYYRFEKENLNTDVIKRIRGEINRYYRRNPSLKNMRNSELSMAIFENVVSTYINHHRSVDYSPALVHLCAPFVSCLSKESEVYYCFEKLIKQLDEHFASHNLNEQVAHFVTLFRMLLPDLYSYFEEEEVDPNEWATSWLQCLLSKELPLDCVLRLWDTYFSDRDGLNLHIYVCLGTRTSFGA
ncbi:ankyrin repeat-containing protein [Paraphysoderma sedebokerense]|nr:ankyrin repeat-containing protein [Paraphysoderma sedebokerense]